MVRRIRQSQRSNVMAVGNTRSARGIRAAALLWLACSAALNAQQSQPATTALTPVPRLVWFSGSFRPADGLPLTPVESVTLSVYRDREGGDALWQETQNVAVDGDGHYRVLIGSTLSDGLPLDLFTAGEPRWIGIRFNRPGEVEQPRAHLASVPYALKAADADTLGGKPASAYVLAEPVPSPATPGTAAPASKHSDKAASPNTAGTAGYLGMFVDSANLGNSALFQSGSSIGLGTTGPADAFHVALNNGTGSATGYAVQNLSGAAGAYSGMLFFDQNGALGQFQGFNNATHEYRINNIASAGSINFMIGSNSKFLVANSGKVGIGTTAPASKLEVFDSSNTGLRVQTDTAGGTVASFGGIGEFQIDAPFNPGGRLRVLENGRVGIGLSLGFAPTFKLEVIDSSNKGLRVQTNAAGGTVASFGGNGDFQIDLPGVNGGRLVVKENGNVGIGTTSPDSPLTVNGAASKPGGGSWAVFSDERLKDIKGPFTPGLQAVMQLQPLRYEYKPDNALGLRSSGEHIGFGAQAVQKIIPEAVSRNDKGYLLVNNDPILWTMLNAIKEQQKEIQALLNEVQRQQTELGALAQRDRDLQDRVAKLESALGARR
jgi:hypothetical protein